MKLHDAILNVLENKGVPLSFNELTIELNELKLYERKDQKNLGQSQIQSRIRNYPSLFTVINGFVMSTDNPKWRNIFSTASSLGSLLRGFGNKSDSEFIILTSIFYKRLLDLGRISSSVITDNEFSNYHGEAFPDFQKHILIDWLRELTILDTLLEGGFRIFDDYVELLNRMDNSTLFKTFEIVKDFDSTPFTNSEFGKAFELILEINQDKASKPGFTRTPRDVIELMCQLLNPLFGKIYDPVCGTAGFLTEAGRMSNNLELYGSEINYRVARIAYINLIMNGHEDARLNTENCFAQLENNLSYDYIIGDLPIGGGTLGEYIHELTFEWGLNLSRKSKSFGVFLLLALSKMSSTGKAIFTVADSFLYRGGIDQIIRNRLLEIDVIESIISLPNGILKPYTKGKASLIVLNRNKPDYLLEKIKFIDLSDERKYRDLGIESINEIYLRQRENIYSQTVSVSQILEFNTLNPNYYTQELFKLRELLITDSAKFLNQITNIQSGKSLKNYSESDEFSGIPYVKIENLERDVLDMYLSKESVKNFIDELTISDPKYIIDKECILIGKIGDNLKPTIFRPSSQSDKIIIHQNVVAIFKKPKVEVNLEFLYYQFYSDIVKNQLDKYRPASIVPFLTLKAIKELIIPFPDFISQTNFIEFQKASVIAAEKARIDQRLSKIGYKEEAEERELDIVRTITHQLRHKLSSLHLIIEKAKSITEVRGLGSSKQYEDSDPMLKAGPGFEIPENETLDETLKKAEHKSEFLSKLLTDVEKAINLNMSFDRCDLIDLLEATCKDFRSEKLNVEVIGRPVKIELSKSHIKDLVETLIQNAIEHSFKDASGKRNKIEFRVKSDINRNLVLIEYLNNGSPMLISQKEYISILTKSKSSSGSGIGGYYINKIIEGHHGSFSIDEEYNKGVKITIELPINQDK